MKRKTYFVVSFVGAAVFVLFLTARAQKQVDPAVLLNDVSQEVSGLDQKIEKIRGTSEANDQKILQKLDEVLNNQKQILEELRIVKVRATQR